VKHGEGDRPDQSIVGGTQQNVLFARDIGTVEIHGAYEIHSGTGAGPGAPWYRRSGPAGRLAIGLVGVLLLVIRPALPGSLPERTGLGPVAFGSLLIACALLAEAGTRVSRAVARRRRAAWRSERNLARTADALAESLSFRYGQDERLARINDPLPLAVTWTTGPVGTPAAEGGSGYEDHRDDDCENHREDDRDGPGRRPGPAADEAAIAGLFTAGPARRLVVLGGAGAGKSVLVLRLAHALLRERARGSQDPVPAIVSLASWDPGHGLLGWLAERLAEEYPDAFASLAGAPPADVAFHLLLTRRVLPVLDGFDELPEPRRADALRQITATMAGRRPFVLTSREPEYREHAPEEALFERAEIRLSPLSDDAVRAYLAPGGTRSRWAPVLDRLSGRTDPADGEAPEVRRLRDALGVPLMVGLARVAYARGDSDPRELLEPARFDSRQDIERHLYDAFLDVVYSASHDVQAVRGGWAPERARAWAGFLASRMKETNEQDLAWWRLDETVPRAVRVLALAPAFALAAVLVAGMDFGAPWWHDRLPLEVPGGFVLLCVLVLAAAAGRPPTWHFPPRRLARPSRAEAPATGPLARWRRALLILLPLGLAAGWATALTADDPAPRWAMTLPTSVVAWMSGAWAVAAVWRRSDPTSADSPAALLRADRRGVLALGWSAPFKRGLTDTPLSVLTLPAAMLAVWQWFGGVDVVTGRDWIRLAVGLPLVWALYAFGVSAWGGFTVARLYLWGTGRLPRRLMAFLEDAHARGVLRQSGGVYRFRHIELRDRLARDTDGGTTARARPGSRLAVPLRVASALLLVTAVLAGGAIVFAAPTSAPLPGPVRSLPAACALFDREDLDRLMETPAIVVGKDGRTCGAGEQAPFVRGIGITVGTSLLTGKNRFERGPDTARTAYLTAQKAAESWARSDTASGFHRTFSGLGDEAYVSAVRNPYRTTPEVRELDGFAEVGVRIANAFLYVRYDEEFASAERAAEAARILAEEAVRRAGLTGGASRAEGAEAATPGTAGTPVGRRSLADLPPPTKIPDSGNRFAYYFRGPARSVRGATWNGDERSYLWYLRQAPVVFRAPKQLVCTRADADDPVTYGCRADPDAVKAGLLPDLRLDLRFHSCGASCGEEEKLAFLRTAPDHERTSWTKIDDSTYVAAGPGARADRYRIAMKHAWAWRDRKTKVPYIYLLWVRADVPQEDAATAQKVVNDLLTQADSLRTAG
jgi:hypothetical protein